MNPIELNLRVTVDESNIRAVVNVIRQALHVGMEGDARAEGRMKASRNALFAGQKPPDDRGLLIDTNQAAKLLKVSARTVHRMAHEGEIPKAIRIGKSVRWSLDELHDWVRAGCPKSNREAKKPKVIRVKERPKEETNKGIRLGFSELYTELGLNPADFPSLSAKEIIQIAGDAADAFRNWTCGVPMTANGTSKLRERLSQFAERVKTERGDRLIS